MGSKLVHPCKHASGNGAKPFKCLASRNKDQLCSCQRWCTLKREYEATACTGCKKFSAQ